MVGKDFERDFKDEFSEAYAKDTFEFYKKINLKKKYFTDTKVRGLEKIANETALSREEFKRKINVCLRDPEGCL